MKTLMLAIMVFLTGFIAVAEEERILDLAFSFEAGYLPANSWILHETEYTDNSNFYASFNARLLLLDLIFVGGSVRSNFSSTESLDKFYPSDNWYGFESGIIIGGFEAGVRHSCFHPVMPYVYSEGIGKTNIEGAYTEIYIKFSGKVKLF